MSFLSGRVVRAVPLTFLIAASIAGCHRVRNVATAPQIVRISPSPIVIRSGMNAELTILGTDFVADSNSVSFGPYSFDGIRSTENGTVIHLNIPDRMPSRGGAAPMLWVAADYHVVVSNRNGRSAPMTASLTVRE